MAIAETALGAQEHKGLLDVLRQAKKETNNLANERNDIVHGDYHYSLSEPPTTFSALADPNLEFSIALSPGTDWRKRANIFAGKNLDEELPSLINDIRRLIVQLDNLKYHLLLKYVPDGPEGPALLGGMPEILKQALLPVYLHAIPITELVWTPIRPHARGAPDN